MKQKIFVSTDPILYSLQEEQLYILFLKNKKTNELRLPGGLIDPNRENDLQDAAKNNLLEKTGIESSYFEQLKTYGSSNRDNRGMRDENNPWTISVAYMAITAEPEKILKQSKDLNYDLIWIKENELSQYNYMFDHKDIVIDATNRLKNKVNYSILPAYFLKEEFTFSQLKSIYEIILNEKLDKSSFIKKIEETNSIEKIDGKFLHGAFRPAQLWRIKKLTNFNKNLKSKM